MVRRMMAPHGNQQRQEGTQAPMNTLRELCMQKIVYSSWPWVMPRAPPTTTQLDEESVPPAINLRIDRPGQPESVPPAIEQEVDRPGQPEAVTPAIKQQDDRPGLLKEEADDPAQHQDADPADATMKELERRTERCERLIESQTGVMRSIVRNVKANSAAIRRLQEPRGVRMEVARRTTTPAAEQHEETSTSRAVTAERPELSDRPSTSRRRETPGVEETTVRRPVLRPTRKRTATATRGGIEAYFAKQSTQDKQRIATGPEGEAPSDDDDVTVIAQIFRPAGSSRRQGSLTTNPDAAQLPGTATHRRGSAPAEQEETPTQGCSKSR